MARTEAARFAAPDAEVALIGAALVDSGACRALLELDREAFAVRRHRLAFAAIESLRSRGVPIDVVTVSEELEAGEALEAAGGISAVAALADAAGTAANAPAYVEIIREKAQRRRIGQALRDAIERNESGAGSAAEIGADLAARLSSIGSAGGRVMPMAEIIAEAEAAAMDAHARRRAGGVVGCPFGLPTLDAFTGGIRGPRLVIVAGRPGVGKTAIAQQLAIESAGRGFRIGLISLEMTAGETGLRFIAARLGLNAAALARGDADEFQELQAAGAGDRIRALRSLPIFARFDAFSLGAVISEIAGLRISETIDLAIVDHIGLIEAAGFATRNDQLGHVSRALKQLAKQLEIPIVALSQLSRRSEQESRRPKLSDLRDSGNIEQDADAVIALHARDDENGNATEIEIGLLKLRDGVRGWLPARFRFDGRRQRFQEIAPAPNGYHSRNDEDDEP